MEIKRWYLPAQKTRFQLRILNILLGNVPYRGLGVKLRPSPSHVKNFFQIVQGNIVSHYI